MSQIRNVSDTARWVAVYRAMETERPDAIFRDPFAARLAGAHGEAIVDSMQRGRQMAWAMIVRTAVFDEIILERVKRHGVDLVVNLAAGLDARPWRMYDLPPNIRWVDVDLPGILDYKLETLASEKTVCQYEAIRLDLTDGPKRRALFSQLGARVETGPRGHRGSVDLFEGRAGRRAGARPPCREDVSLVADRSDQPGIVQDDAAVRGKAARREQRAVPVRPGRRDEVLRAIRLA